MEPSDITVVVASYGRGRLLLDTLEAVLAQEPRLEAVAVDQTPEHPVDVESRLAALAESGRLRLLRLPRPSVVTAMNTGLGAATRPLVLFLDDDVVPEPFLLAAHARAYTDNVIWAVAGQVLERGEAPTEDQGRFETVGLRAHLDFRFNSCRRAFVLNCMAGNLSVRRQAALQIGGFDENFVGVGHRFETDFARRLTAAGGAVLFEPAASVRHLKAESGGIRAFGDPRRSASPAQGVGDYYFALRHGTARESLTYIARRVIRQGIVTRYLARHPWFIPPRLLGELRALWLAGRLHREGPRLPGGRAQGLNSTMRPERKSS